MEPFSLTEKQTQTIIKYIKERRYPFMISLYGIIGFLILLLTGLLLPAIAVIAVVLICSLILRAKRA